jgi:hypothetical protein
MHELQRGDVLKRDGRKLVRRVRELCAGRVFNHSGREQFDCVCFVSRRHVFKHGGGERVCFMPDRVLVLDSRIRSHHKLLLKRRVLRSEWWCLHGLCITSYFFETGKSDGD